ncbi:MAG: addiction module antitoxin RelB [bacterium]|nr:addiction module antitoxin RelB [bacterium]
MEIIKDDLCRKADGVESPAWHEDVLLKREEDLQFGTDILIDWDSAKKEIRKEIE